MQVHRGDTRETRETNILGFTVPGEQGRRTILKIGLVLFEPQGPGAHGYCTRADSVDDGFQVENQPPFVILNGQPDCHGAKVQGRSQSEVCWLLIYSDRASIYIDEKRCDLGTQRRVVSVAIKAAVGVIADVADRTVVGALSTFVDVGAIKAAVGVAAGIPIATVVGAFSTFVDVDAIKAAVGVAAGIPIATVVGAFSAFVDVVAGEAAHCVAA